MTSRAELRHKLENTEFDLAIVGGGVTGAGIARDAALRGLRVVLLEKGDLARGTSSASSKLIHGGLRYLEQLELGLVREGVRERSVLMRLAPHLARPLPFIFPIYKSTRASPMKVKAGMMLYDALALFGNYRMHRMLPRRQTERAEPLLRREGLRASTLYYDCMTDDARLVVETALDAEARGAVIATYSEVTSFRRDQAGQVTGVRVRDVLEDESGGGGPQFDVKARVTLVASGPWTDQVLALAAGERRHLLRPTKGVHIVLDRARLPLDHAIVLTAVRDARVLFAIPWGERTVFGTTDTDDAHGPEHCHADAWDVAYLLETANHYFPSVRATEDDVIATWAGLRPLMAHDPNATASQVSREHEILDVQPGLMVIAGGKLTTYRLMAEQAVDRVVPKLASRKAAFDRCRTETTPLPGAVDLDDLERAAESVAKGHSLEPDIARHLIHAYGVRAATVLKVGRENGAGPERIVPDLPYVWAEVAYSAAAEHAYRLDDVLRRRTNLFLKDKDQALTLASQAASIAGRVLGWDAERQRLEVERYRRLVGESRAFRKDLLVPSPQARATV